MQMYLIAFSDTRPECCYYRVEIVRASIPSLRIGYLRAGAPLPVVHQVSSVHLDRNCDAQVLYSALVGAADVHNARCNLQQHMAGCLGSPSHPDP